MFVSPYLFQSRTNKQRLPSLGPYVIPGMGATWPIHRASPDYISLFLDESEVFFEDDEENPVTYIIVHEGELHLADPSNSDATKVIVTFVPSLTEHPASYFIDLNLASLAAHTFATELSLEKVDPITGFIVPHSSYTPQSIQDLPEIVSHILSMTDTGIGSPLWCLTLSNQFLTPVWQPAFKQEHVKLPDDSSWLARVWNTLGLPPSLHGPRMHCRYFAADSQEKRCVFGLHAESLSWWRMVRNLGLQTHVISDNGWHIGRDLLAQELSDRGHSVLSEQIAPRGSIQGQEWDGVAVIILWDGISR